ncbi:NADH dehydrogenase alpha subcomplex subunit 8 [Phellopilus nigrolimitatus]|nr:NADH dehydrogenase alpha subcomplex subunit 8 [Phellopilus nigrolimitatus]
MASPMQDPGSSAKPYNDPTPMPADVPKVTELGTTSAPLKSAAFFIGPYCKDYNEDFMLCKAENRDPAHCLKEGRRVTRCATDLITKMRENCLKEFDAHWGCLEKNNQEYYLCRKPERTLNKCMFDKLGLTKTIPNTPEGKTPIHLVESPVFKAVQK